MVFSLHSVTTGSRDRANVSLIIIIIIIMATHDCPLVRCHAMHQSRSRMVNTIQLTYIICSKACSWRDVDLVNRNAVYQ